MNTLQLTYFLKVCEIGQISKASKELFISQPSLSQTIKALEKEIGTELFTRNNNSITLSENGKIFRIYAETALAALSDAHKAIQDNMGSLSNIKLSYRAATSMLPGIVTEFKKNFPDIQLIINQADIKDTSAEADLYVFASDFEINNDCSLTLLTEDCLIGMSVDNPLTTEKIISPEMLKNETFLTLQGNTPLSRLTHSLCEKGGFYPKVELELDTREIIFSMISIGAGVALIPQKTWAPLINNEQIVLRKLSTTTMRYIILQWKNSAYFSKGMKLMIEFLKNYFANK